MLGEYKASKTSPSDNTLANKNMKCAVLLLKIYTVQSFETQHTEWSFFIPNHICFKSKTEIFIVIFSWIGFLWQISIHIFPFSPCRYFSILHAKNILFSRWQWNCCTSLRSGSSEAKTFVLPTTFFDLIGDGKKTTKKKKQPKSPKTPRTDLALPLASSHLHPRCAVFCANSLLAQWTQVQHNISSLKYDYTLLGFCSQLRIAVSHMAYGHLIGWQP